MSRHAILVLGMHRSGTSALTGTLVKLGASAPAHLLPTDEHNPAGYWESAPFTRLHEDLLKQLGTSWHGWTSLAPEWLSLPLAQPFLTKCSRLLREEFHDAPLFVVKDPRMCRVVPFWTQILDQERITASAVLVFRNPIEVAQSLARRDHIGTERSLLLWLCNVLQAERHTRAMPRSFVRYDDLFDDCRTVAAQIATDLNLAWPFPIASLDPESCIDHGLRHYRLPFESRNSSAVWQWVGEVWTALECLASPRDSGHGTALQSLDAIRTQFDEASAVFGKVAAEELQMIVDRTDAERTRFEDEGQRLRDEAAALQAALAGAHAEKAALQDAFERLTADRHRAVERADQIQSALNTALQTQDQLRSNANQLATQLQHATSAREALQRELAETERHRNQLTADLDSAQHRVESLLNSLSWRATLPARRLVDALKRIVNPSNT